MLGHRLVNAPAHALQCVGHGAGATHLDRDGEGSAGEAGAGARDIALAGRDRFGDTLDRARSHTQRAALLVGEEDVRIVVELWWRSRG